MATPNVIVFGETGAGKSSLVNLIAGSSVAQISSRSAGCTFQSTCFPVNIGNKQFNLYDTAGLDEGQGGTIAKQDAIHDAIVQLYTLLRRLNTGVSLLVFCMRGPRIKESCVKNWRLFHEIICQRKVPIVLAVTGLENEEDGMDYWWTQNKEYFMRYEMYPNGVACITATRGRKMSGGGYRFDEEYAESRIKMREAIRTVYLRTPWQVPTAEWFKEIIEHPEEIRQSRLALGSFPASGTPTTEFPTKAKNIVLTSFPSSNTDLPYRHTMLFRRLVKLQRMVGIKWARRCTQICFPFWRLLRIEELLILHSIDITPVVMSHHELDLSSLMMEHCLELFSLLLCFGEEFSKTMLIEV
ncbi:P-loop containing nucleoside triphosphate hydrolase protein [Amanita rubescens]|nr:P-loop containing nucleoside triphosphate hydrolase protein [Amanita rubescens]